MTEDPEQHKSELKRDYDSSAAGYDSHWGPALAQLSQRFIQRLGPLDGQAVLDAGAGSGAMLRYLLETTSSTVVGTDLSLGMLSLAPAGALRAVMDTENLGFKPDTFDIVLAMFVLFHLPDPITGLRGIHRVLKEGGTMAFTTWGDDDPDFEAFDVIDEVLDRHGAAHGRGLYARYDLSDTPEKCSDLLERAGFGVISVRTERMAYQWTVDHLIGFRTQVGFGRARIESLDRDAQAAAVQEARGALAQLPPKALILRDEVIYSVGRSTG